MRLLLVASGRIAIPPPGWGAVEKLLGEQQRYLTENRLATVDILNRRHPALWQLLRTRPWRYDLVHSNDDSRYLYWLKASRSLRFRLAVTTYHGYAAFPDRWSPRFTRQFDAMRHADAFFALSPRIARIATDRGFHNPVIVQPSGLFCGDMHFQAEAVRQAVVLGKVDERKKQAFLAGALVGAPVTCDLIGPLGAGTPADFDGNGVNVRYKGEWRRADVCEKLTEYACLVLLSDGEAHPLVVMEALASGVSVVVSEEAAENLDIDLPFIFRVGRDDRDGIISAIEQAVSENSRYRAEIRRYCEKTFDWSVLMPRYLRHIDEVTRIGSLSQ